MAFSETKYESVEVPKFGNEDWLLKTDVVVLADCKGISLAF